MWKRTWNRIDLILTRLEDERSQSKTIAHPHTHTHTHEEEEAVEEEA